MSQTKLLIATAILAGSATTAAYAVEAAKEVDAAQMPATNAEAAKKPVMKKSAHKAKKAVVKEVPHLQHQTGHHKAAEPKGLTVTLGGEVDVQGGYRKQKGTYDTNRPGYVLQTDEFAEKTQKFAVVNDTKINVQADGNAHGMKYGGKVVLRADSSGSKYGYGMQRDNIAEETKVWVGSKFGKVEAGNTPGVYAALHVSAADVAHATGGASEGDYQYWINPFLYTDGSSTSSNILWIPEHFHINANLPSNYVRGLDANAAKISYTTPTMMNVVKLGASFVPDTDQYGTVSRSQSVFKKLASTLTGYKNLWELAGSAKYKFSKDLMVRVTAAGNIGEAKDYVLVNPTATSRSLARHDLRAWEAGGLVDYMGFKFAGSYGDMGKSGAVKTYDGTNLLSGKKKTNFWTVGAGYTYNSVGVSVTYFESNHGAAPVRRTGSSITANSGGLVQPSVGAPSVIVLDKSNKYSAVAVGVDYVMAPGFMPYAEFVSFEAKEGNPNQVLNSTSNALSKRYKNSGFVVLAGTKLHF